MKFFLAADILTGLCIEWAKAKARALRWYEEVRLVCEEMRRAVVYCQWKARWWQQQAERRPDASPEVREGLRAYALEHTAEENSMAVRWSTGWQPALEAAQTFLAEKDDEIPSPQEDTVAAGSATSDVASGPSTVVPPPRVPAFRVLDTTLDGEDSFESDDEGWDEDEA